MTRVPTRDRTDGTEGTRRIVYVTYDGLEDPLGRSQVRPYVEALARRGHRFEIVSFEKSGVPWRLREPIADRIRWTALRYHRRPTVPATAFDMAQGLAATVVTSVLSRANLVHVRSYVAAALVLPWVAAARVPWLFDMRGFWADEKVEGGAWTRGGRLHRSAKAIERVLLKRADAIVVLTQSMRDYLRQEYPHRADIGAAIHVIPTCTDLDRFSPAVARDASLAGELDEARVLAYSGSLETRYMADTMARFYLAWRAAVHAVDGPSRATRFLVVSQSDPGAIEAVLGSAGVARELVHRPARHDEVPALMRWAEAGIFLLLPTFSARGSSPTKVGEMLACGIPVAANAVGDLAQVFRDASAALIIDDMNDEGLRRAARELVEVGLRPDVRREARALAERWFRLEDGVDALDSIYRGLPSARHPKRVAI